MIHVQKCPQRCTGSTHIPVSSPIHPHFTSYTGAQKMLDLCRYPHWMSHRLWFVCCTHLLSFEPLECRRPLHRDWTLTRCMGWLRLNKVAWNTGSVGLLKWWRCEVSDAFRIALQPCISKWSQVTVGTVGSAQISTKRMFPVSYHRSIMIWASPQKGILPKQNRKDLFCY